MAYAHKASAFLSMMCSGWILWDCLKCRKQKRTTYHNILLLMSLFELMSSLWNCLGTWAATGDKARELGLPPLLFDSDKGNQATCSAQGFFLQPGLAAPLYNVSQVLYPLLIVRYGWKKQRIGGKPVGYASLGLPFLFAFSTAVAGRPLELYNFNPATFTCWITPFPLHRDFLVGKKEPRGPCVRVDNAFVYQFAFIFVPLWLSFFVLVAADRCRSQSLSVGNGCF